MDIKVQRLYSGSGKRTTNTEPKKDFSKLNLADHLQSKKNFLLLNFSCINNCLVLIIFIILDYCLDQYKCLKSDYSFKISRFLTLASDRGPQKTYKRKQKQYDKDSTQKKKKIVDGDNSFLPLLNSTRETVGFLDNTVDTAENESDDD